MIVIFRRRGARLPRVCVRGRWRSADADANDADADAKSAKKCKKVIDNFKIV